jgi:hypothetical protein
MKLAILRRTVTIVAASAIMLGAGAGAALAFPSGQNPGKTGPNDIEWTGHGDGSISPSGSGACLTEPNGQPANTPYLLWVLTPDGGSIANTSPPTPGWFPPVLHLTGTQAGLPVNANPGDGSTAGTLLHFVTPYFTPDLNTLSASLSMYVTDPGSGNWNLNISHGCAPPSIVQAQSPTVKKDASAAYTTTNSWSVSKSVDQKEIDTSPSGTPVFNYTVTVNESQSNSDVTVSGDILVNNPNSQPIDMSGGSIVDQLNGDGNHSCQLTHGPPSQLSAGDNDLPYTCTIPFADYTPGAPLTNTVTVTWADQMLDASTHLAAGNASFTTQQITPTQNVNGPTCVSLSDTQAPSGALPSQVCESDLTNGTWVKTYAVGYPITTQNPNMVGTCTPFTNVVTISDANGHSLGSDSRTVKVCVGADLTVKKDATPSFTRTYNWNLVKAVVGPPSQNTPQGTPASFNYGVTASVTGSTDSNWQVTGTIHVTNPNDWESVGLTGVTDAIDNNGGQPCKITSGDPNGTIAAGAKVDLGYECDYASAPSPSSFTNTATATWSASAANTADGSAQGQAQGDFANASPTVKDGSLDVTDTLGGHLGTVTVASAPQTFTYSHSFDGVPGTCTNYPNTATGTTSDTGTTVQSSQTVKVCVGADLQVSKKAGPAFSRTYNWSIAKQADKTLIDPGGTVNYTVQVNQTGVTDSGWQVSGTITVTNPNDFESITAAVGDTIDNGGMCQVPGGASVSIPAGQQATLPYTCTFGSNPGSGTNTATAAWDKSAASTPHGVAQGTASYDFANATITRTNQTIHVVDSQAGSLGTLTGVDNGPFPHVFPPFTYSKTFQPPASGCTTINNTATITETGQNGQASVKNCSVGALTMGFWQNKNGQTIINNANQGALQTYLLQYSMFSDAPATGIAAYFTKVFSAATASGTGAAMLKAQSLATALDVYFSGTKNGVGGGNQIGAFNGNGPNQVWIGDVTINTSQWSAAFGGATSLTVSQMLSYVSSQWNGGNPYAGNKTQVTTAISAFNAVNNDQAPLKL